MVSELEEVVKQVRRELEEHIREYVANSHRQWTEGGVSEEAIQIFREVNDLMETQKKGAVEWHLNQVEQEQD